MASGRVPFRSRGRPAHLCGFDAIRAPLITDG